MHDKLFCQLDDWNQLCEEQNEITEAIAKLVGLPNAAIVLMTAYKDAIERELELWQKLSPHFESRPQAALALAAEVEKRRNKE